MSMREPSPSEELLNLLAIDGDIPLIQQALTHASYVNEHPGVVDYERLEFLGDAVLGLCVSELLLDKSPCSTEGQLTRMRAALVNTKALASFARKTGLGRFVRFGRGAADSGDSCQDKVLADVVEAIVAAVYRAQGMSGARELTQQIVGDATENASDIGALDPKSRLQEHLQKGGGAAPVYRIVHMEGPDNDRVFEVEVEANGIAFGRGRGRSKKEAEREAARDGLAKYLAKEARDL